MTETEAPPTWRPSTPQDLLSKGAHRATLPSGAQAMIRFPPLGALIRVGAVPRELRELAKAEISIPGGAAAYVGEAVHAADPTKPDEWEIVEEKLQELRDFYTWIVAEHTLIEPRLTVEQVASGEMDDRDFELLIDIARRRRDTDAEGVRLGVMSLEDMAVFRDEHGCAPDCDRCARAKSRLSSTRMVPL